MTNYQFVLLLLGVILIGTGLVYPVAFVLYLLRKRDRSDD